MGKVMISGVAPQMTEPGTFDPVFENNTWEQIIKACKRKKIPETWVVGDQKSMTINGAEYAVDIIGKNHDSYSDGSGAAPLTFQLHDCYGTEYQMNSSETNVGGWTNCEMRKTHLTSILSLMQSEVKDGIKEVNKLTSAGNASSIINTTADKLFLLSEVEVYGSTEYSVLGEGSQYAYYAAGNSKKKTVNGSTQAWWERSPRINNTGEFCACSGSNADRVPAYGNRGVSFAFCF